MGCSFVALGNSTASGPVLLARAPIPRSTRPSRSCDRWLGEFEQRNYLVQNPLYRAMWDRFDPEANLTL